MTKKEYTNSRARNEEKHGKENKNHPSILYFGMVGTYMIEM